MKKIVDNYLFLTDIEEFDQKLLDMFFYRLSVFLNTFIDKPSLKMLKFHKEDRAWYEHWSNKIVFLSEKYRIESKYFSFDKEEIEGSTMIDIDDYKYVFLLSDIYHELIHAYQYDATQWMHGHVVEMSDVFVEGSNDLFTAMITGQINIDYTRETTAIWYFLRKMLKIKRLDILYNATRDIIIEPYFFTSDVYKIKKYVDLNTEGNIIKLIKHIDKLNMSKYIKECEQDILGVHNLIFYRW